MLHNLFEKHPDLPSASVFAVQLKIKENHSRLKFQRLNKPDLELAPVY